MVSSGAVSLALLQAAPLGEATTLVPALDLAAAARVLAMLVIGVPASFLVSRWVRAWITSEISAQTGLIAGKLVFYCALGTLGVITMTELGFSLTPLLGAAGILGIALGFASQTSVSNVIAGLFLLAESPFVVGDLIQVGDVTGFVLSVDTMSVKLRTLDNRFVRIPNETLVKSTVTTITRFPIRRLDVRVGVAYHERPSRVREILLDVADRNPRALMEPQPIVVFEGFGDSSLNFLFGVWATKENWLAMKNSIQEDVKARFDEEGIEIPFPHRTLYAGSQTEAFPIQIVQDGSGVARRTSQDTQEDPSGLAAKGGADSSAAGASARAPKRGSRGVGAPDADSGSERD